MTLHSINYKKYSILIKTLMRINMKCEVVYYRTILYVVLNFKDNTYLEQNIKNNKICCFFPQHLPCIISKYTQNTNFTKPLSWRTGVWHMTCETDTDQIFFNVFLTNWRNIIWSSHLFHIIRSSPPLWNYIVTSYKNVVHIILLSSSDLWFFFSTI